MAIPQVLGQAGNAGTGFDDAAQHPAVPGRKTSQADETTWKKPWKEPRTVNKIDEKQQTTDKIDEEHQTMDKIDEHHQTIDKLHGKTSNHGQN